MSNAHVKKVMIIGGGIGGLSSAIALSRLGIETEIVEVKKEWDVYGVGIFQPPNALRALDELGVADECLRQGFSFDGMGYCDAQGNQFAEPRAPKINGYPGLNVISRRILHDILFESAKSHGTKFRMGASVETLQQEESQVHVKLTDGTSHDCDLVIGADGVNSKVRDLIFGQIEKSYVGQAVWRYTLPRFEQLHHSTLYYGPNAKAGLVPMSKEKMYLLLTTSEPGNPKMPKEKLHDLLRERLEAFGGLVAEAREQIVDPDEVVYRPIYSYLLPAPWYKGRVLLIGDAAHCCTPHIGQGASLAIEDAVVLAELMKKQESVEKMLSAFMERRFERSRMLVENCQQLVEWEFLEWERKLPKEINVAKFANETLTKMNEAI